MDDEKGGDPRGIGFFPSRSIDMLTMRCPASHQFSPLQRIVGLGQVNAIS